MIKVDIRDDRDRGGFRKVFEHLMIILRGVAETDDVTADRIQFADSNEQRLGHLHINRQRLVIHRLDEDWLALPDRQISYMDKMNVIHRLFSLS